MKRRHTVRILSLILVSLLSVGFLCSCDDLDDSSSSSSLAEMVANGEATQAQRGTKTLNITRVDQTAKKPKDIAKDSWTVFVYLCGSDLESQNGAASGDLTEMVNASGSNNVTFVVETGGAKEWKTNIKSNKLTRLIVQNGTIRELERVKNGSMGDPEVLSDFLTWGIENFPAEKMGLILWDHGAGSISGVCFDEINDYNALSLSELNGALLAANSKLWDKLEFVGFDACLMSTLETANVLASYAKYMIASQETEPATGWDYNALINYLGKNPSCDGAALGKALCDTYLTSLTSSSAGWATLSVVDLSKVDELVQSFYRFSQEMYESGSNQSALAAMTRGIKRAENYGSNNWLEGYTNMVDLYGIVSACADVTPSAADVRAALDNAVVYQVRGKYHSESCGLSTYYPLRITDSTELSTFQQIAVNPSYLSYVDRLAHSGTYGGGSDYVPFPDDTWYEDGIWNWSVNEGQAQGQGQTQDQGQSQEQTQDQGQGQGHWDYVDQHTDSSTVITLAEPPQLDLEGSYWFQLDKHGIDNASAVSALLFMPSADGKDTIALGETYDIYADWDTGTFYDGFDGNWLSLPDGQNLCLYVAESNDEFVTFTSPITLNGKACFLRLTQEYESGDVMVEGVWTALGENGTLDRGLTALKRGDVIVPRYDAMTVGGNEKSVYEGSAYTITGKGLSVDYGPLMAGSYLYSFRIQDVYGDSYIADPVEFEIDELGGIYFYE